MLNVYDRFAWLKFDPRERRKMAALSLIECAETPPGRISSGAASEMHPPSRGGLPDRWCCVSDGGYAYQIRHGLHRWWRTSTCSERQRVIMASVAVPVSARRRSSLGECEPCELRRGGEAAQYHHGEVELVGSGLACSDQQRGSGDYGRKRRAMVGRVARAIEAWASTV